MSKLIHSLDHQTARWPGLMVVGFIKDLSFRQGPAAICSGRLYRCIIPGGRVTGPETQRASPARASGRCTADISLQPVITGLEVV